MRKFKEIRSLYKRLLVKYPMRKVADVMREIFQGENMKFVVLSRFLATREYNEPFINISITDPEKQPIELPITENRKAVLRLQFHDADANDSRHTIITPEQALEIVNFVEEWKDKASLIVVNCEAGLCRSAGIAAALSLWLNNTDKFFFEHYLPNRTVYRAVVNAANQIS